MNIKLKLGLAYALMTSQTGCIGIGPASIQNDRSFYNSAIRTTNNEQILNNIVAANNFENPVFINITKVAATRSLSAGTNGGSSNIGGLPAIGQLSGMFNVNDTPVAEYVPLQGHELIQQISNPILLSNVYRLYTSNSGSIPLFGLTFSRISPGYIDYNLTLNILFLLDNLGAITVSASDNTFDIVFAPDGSLTNPSKIVSADRRVGCISDKISKDYVIYLWSELQRIHKQSGDVIRLITPGSSSKGTLVVTRTGQGALQQAQTQNITFFDRDYAQLIRNNNNIDCGASEFYFGTYRNSEPVNEKWRKFYRTAINRSISAATKAMILRDIVIDRILIMVEKSSYRPEDAYVSIYREGVWYSINNHDNISKKNFSLLSTILTIQAPPTPVSSLVTSINVGASR